MPMRATAAHPGRVRLVRNAVPAEKAPHGPIPCMDGAGPFPAERPMLKALISLAVALTVIPAGHAAASTAPPPAPAVAAAAATPVPVPPGMAPVSSQTAAVTDGELRERVTRLTARARTQARRLGLSTAMGDVPRRPELLQRRERRLVSVLGFLSRTREVRLAVDERPAPPVRPRGAALTARIARQHSLAVRRSAALGVERPGRLRIASTRQARVAQLAHWRTVSSFLRARTERVRPAERPLSERLPHYDALMCIAEHESHGTWDISTGNGYYGGLQMDRTFQQTYSPGLYRAKGTADNWTQEEQMRTAVKAIATRGFTPWPNTARMCGLL